jgi:putative DNA primase/helicase
MSDPITIFLAAMDRAGIAPAEPVTLAPGQLIRFRAEGDKPGRRNGWAILHTDGTPCGAFGNWRLGIRHTWRDGEKGRDLSPVERRAIAARIRESEAERARQHWRAADLVVTIYREAPPADLNHPYPARKALTPASLRQHGRNLIVPMIDERHKLWNVQRIDGDGTKRFFKGGRTDGLFWSHGAFVMDGRPSHGPLVLAEGWATAAAIREATGFGVVAAMSAKNLLAVAQSLRRLFPIRCIIIAADWDGHLAENMGLICARKAAHAICGYLALPVRLDAETDSAGLGIDFADIPRAEAAAFIHSAIGKAVNRG